jgi:hypothetical protein
MRKCGHRLVLIVAVGWLAAACTWGLAQKVDYRLKSLANLPLNLSATDGAEPFARRFCSTLRHLDSQKTEWGECSTWLETPVPDQQPETAPISKKYGVLAVAGIFAQCFSSQGVRIFEQGLKHLSDAHQLTVYEIPVSGVGSSEANAAQIDAFLKDHPGEYIAVGYSKGIADLLVAIQKYSSAKAQIKVLASVAGAVGGSRLADLRGNPLRLRSATLARGDAHRQNANEPDEKVRHTQPPDCLSDE